MVNNLLLRETHQRSVSAPHKTLSDLREVALKGPIEEWRRENVATALV